MVQQQILSIPIQRHDGNHYQPITDLVAIEEPLEMQICFGRAENRTMQNLSVTMRTPGHDEELMAGFLLTEGIIQHFSDLQSVRSTSGNSVMASLQESHLVSEKRLERHFYTSSSCGVCGKSSIDAVQWAHPEGNCMAGASPSPAVIGKLPAILRAAQSAFDATGGIHASALFDTDGNLLLIREDVGRHNALDKLIGHFLLKDMLPLNNTILLLSGRASFELIQKSVAAGIPTVCAVGAPSSLAVQTAENFGIRLYGFVKENKHNQYTCF